jgi:hypothetical protein
VAFPARGLGMLDGLSCHEFVFQIGWPQIQRAATSVETSSLVGAMYDRRALAAAPGCSRSSLITLAHRLI